MSSLADTRGAPPVAVEVTDELIDQVRRSLPREFPVSLYNHFAGYDAIRHYAFGIGDDNPLWCDEAYAAQSPIGVMAAPPTFPYSVFNPSVPLGLPQLQALKAGDAWTFHRPVRRDERLQARGRATEVEAREGERGGRFVVMKGVVEYSTTDGEVVATVVAGNLGMVPRGRGPRCLDYPPRPRRRYTASELEQIDAAVQAEQRRGSVPRWWEDVQIGEELVPVVKGPFDQVAMTTYYAGAIGSERYTACELRWNQWRAGHRKADAQGEPDYSHVLRWSNHLDDETAQAVGMPGAYDNGGQRVGWFAHLLTNWMGDHGQLRTLDVQLRRPVTLTDTTWCTGRVSGSSTVGDDHLVTVALTGHDQDGERTTIGSATVALPTRAGESTT